MKPTRSYSKTGLMAAFFAIATVIQPACAATIVTSLVNGDFSAATATGGSDSLATLRTDIANWIHSGNSAPSSASGSLQWPATNNARPVAQTVVDNGNSTGLFNFNLSVSATSLAAGSDIFVYLLGWNSTDTNLLRVDFRNGPDLAGTTGTHIVLGDSVSLLPGSRLAIVNNGSVGSDASGFNASGSLYNYSYQVDLGTTGYEYVTVLFDVEGAQSSGFSIDNVSFTAIPEPSAALLGGLGLLLLLRRRR